MNADSALPTTEVGLLPDPLPEGVAILDVREPVEWEHGHVPGAVHVPLGELVGRRQEVPEGEVLVVCRVGGRSAQAVAWLDQTGHAATAVNLHGGMMEWEAAGRPLVSENGQPPRVI